jgi:hypothetical protein
MPATTSRRIKSKLRTTVQHATTNWLIAVHKASRAGKAMAEAKAAKKHAEKFLAIAVEDAAKAGVL